MRKKLVSLLVLLGCLFLRATIINIPHDHLTIQIGIDASSHGDTVLVQPGTYVENINYNGKNITVASLFITAQDTSYISQTIIDGNQDESVCIFNHGEDSTAVFCGFTIRNGSGHFVQPRFHGGGIYCYNSSPKFKNLKIIDNNASIGGGIFFQNSSSSVSNSTINDNVISFMGAGIYCEQSNIFLSDVVMCYNSAILPGAAGGGIYCCSNSNIEVRNAIISENIVDGTGAKGGAIYCSSNSYLEVRNAIMNENITEGTGAAGGAIYCKYSSLYIESIVNIPVCILNQSRYLKIQ